MNTMAATNGSEIRAARRRMVIQIDRQVRLFESASDSDFFRPSRFFRRDSGVEMIGSTGSGVGVGVAGTSGTDVDGGAAFGADSGVDTGGGFGFGASSPTVAPPSGSYCGRAGDTTGKRAQSLADFLLVWYHSLCVPIYIFLAVPTLGSAAAARPIEVADAERVVLLTV
jgi:hypothetical protein